MPLFKFRPGFGAGHLVWAVGLYLPLSLLAQPGATAPALAPGAADAPSEAVARQALGPYRMILSNARPSAPKAKPVAAPVASAHTTRRKAADTAPVTAPEAPETPAPAAAERAADPVATAASAPSPAGEAAPTPLPPPAPIPAVASVAPAPAPRAAREPAALVPLQQEPPVISNALMKEVPHGLVKLNFEVLPDGSTTAIRVASSTHRKLSAAATAAVAQWRFAPIEERSASEIEFVFSYE